MTRFPGGATPFNGNFKPATGDEVEFPHGDVGLSQIRQSDFSYRGNQVVFEPAKIESSADASQGRPHSDLLPLQTSQASKRRKKAADKMPARGH